MNPTYETYKSAVDQALADFAVLLSDTDDRLTPMPVANREVPQPLRAAMAYSLRLPGKRLRPVLLLAAYHLLQDDWVPVMPYALALEMIHTYSLVHDDLPAMDNDDLRRGKPTNHRVFGENIAILAGDGLYSMALETMLNASLMAKYPQRAIAAMEEIARRAGVSGMIAGQTLDVALEGTEPDETTVAYIHRHKTADLITAPILAGLHLAGATQAQLAAGEAYGQALGLAFQIVDDLLDIRGDAVLLGKKTGKDTQMGKMTWPAVFGEEKACADAERYIDMAQQAVTAFGEKAVFLQTLARDMRNRVK